MGSTPAGRASVGADCISFAPTFFQRSELIHSVAPPFKMRLAPPESHFVIGKTGAIASRRSRFARPGAKNGEGTVRDLARIGKKNGAVLRRGILCGNVSV